MTYCDKIYILLVRIKIMKLGVSWNLIREFSKNGILGAEEVELVEVSFADFNFLKRSDLLEQIKKIKESYDLEYTVHAPHQVSKCGLNVDLGIAGSVEMKIMEKAIEKANMIGAEGLVVHAGDYHGTSSLKRGINCLKRLSRRSSDSGIYLAVENVFTTPDQVRIGEFPEDLLYIVREVNEDSLCIALDVGHANITSKRFGIPLMEYFEKLRDFIRHYHVHNNFDVSSEPWDRHLPLTVGKIDYNSLLRYLDENVILEVRDGSKEDVFRSLALLDSKKLTCVH